jgi:GNAT superfamily N-acetyltransferase
MPVSIRLASNADVDAVVDVIRSVYDEYNFAWDPAGYHADLYDLDAYYHAIGDTFYVAELDGQVIGTVAIERFDPIPGELGGLIEINGYVRVQGCDCSLERLYVHANARRVGAGHAMTRFIVDIAKAEGRTAMELWSDKKFVDAHRLYQRFGAKVVGERICDDPDESPEWGLMIELAN